MEIATNPERGGRVFALDFAKGALVLWMILYHWLNYFVSVDGHFYNYLRFITPSFIFISGFLITNVALKKYGHDGEQLRLRLVERGLKLLILFTVLNVASGILIGGLAANEVGIGPSVQSFLHNAKEVYGTGNGKVAAFQILVPISYLLILSGLLTYTGKHFKAATLLVAALATMLIIALSIAAHPSGQLYCLASGILGLCIGFVPLQRIEQVYRFPHRLLGAYCIYLAFITVWNVSFLVQMIGALLTLLLFYWIGKRCSAAKWSRVVVVLGKYSLFAYIVQIASLHLVRAAVRFVGLGIGSMIVSFVSVFLLTVMIVMLVDFLRSRERIADKLYRYVFA
jgi:peptidoglycan/LPS O-acetylase OafA/YrhL